MQSSVSPGPDPADDAWCWGNDNEEVASSLETAKKLGKIERRWTFHDGMDIYTFAMPRLKIST